MSIVTNGWRQVDGVRSGGSYLSQSALCLHFGVGQARVADTIEVRWPSGVVDRLLNVPVNQRVYIEEGKGLIRNIHLSRAK